MGGCRIAGYSLTTICSKVLQRTGVIEIGLKSARLGGEGILGTGRIEAFFHWRATEVVANDLLNKLARGLQNIGASICRNHAGRLSIPVAVEGNLSKILKLPFRYYFGWYLGGKL